MGTGVDQLHRTPGNVVASRASCPGESVADDDGINRLQTEAHSYGIVVQRSSMTISTSGRKFLKAIEGRCVAA